jgi:micrococcal nuclease
MFAMNAARMARHAVNLGPTIVGPENMGNSALLESGRPCFDRLRGLLSQSRIGKFLALLIAALLPVQLFAAPPTAAEKHITLKVTSVHDGDTFTGINDANEQVKVRLDAVDAPELSQPNGQASRKALGDKIFGKTVTVITKKHDRYGRIIGHVLVDRRDINLELLEEGAVWHYEEYDHNKRLREAEQAARAAKKGLWRDANAIAPWDWRKSERERRKAAAVK